ncbi:hypothetical protein SAMN05216411_10485 [Nitrosospira multiformis]|nr:hypothetical protein SAMN05216411_10485 [Nitrosospira multiformis]
MCEYAVYIRVKEGYIERMNSIISNLPYDPRKKGSLSPTCTKKNLSVSLNRSALEKQYKAYPRHSTH